MEKYLSFNTEKNNKPNAKLKNIGKKNVVWYNLLILKKDVIKNAITGKMNINPLMFFLSFIKKYKHNPKPIIRAYLASPKSLNVIALCLAIYSPAFAVKKENWLETFPEAKNLCLKIAR